MAKENKVATTDANGKKAKKVNPKREARKAARKAARPRIQAFIKENADQLGTLVADLNLFIGSGRQVGSKGVLSGTNTQLRDALIAAGTKGITEVDIFKQFKIGRPEMGHKIRSLLKVPDKSARVWVKFTEADETYRVVGTGEKQPAGWDGYIPTDKVGL